MKKIETRYEGEQFNLHKDEENFVYLFFNARGIDIFFDEEDWKEFKSEMNHVIMMDQFSPN